MTEYILKPPTCYGCGNNAPCMNCKLNGYKKLAETARLTSKVQEEAAKKVMDYEHWYESAFDVDIKIVEPAVRGPMSCPD